MIDYSVYQSPFSWRYGSPAMRSIWSEHSKRLVWRTLWVALAKNQADYGLVSAAQLQDLISHQTNIDIPRALEIESEIHHDLMAELKTFAGQCPTGGGVLHMGATSMDIEDNADALRLRSALQVLISSLDQLLLTFAGLIRKYAQTPVMAFTHIQPAEPTTLGYRLAFTAQDLLATRNSLISICENIKGKGFRGAVGTGAAYGDLVGPENLASFQQTLSETLGLPFFQITHQTAPRTQEYTLLCALAGLGAVLHKFAFDLRVLQSPVIGELSEPFGSKQVGSSAMPFKRNPINAEKINSLARSLAQFPRQAWDYTALSLLERTLDDSAARRTVLPEAFLTADELLSTCQKILNGLRINEAAIQRTLAIYGPFAATEKVLMAAVHAGADRQALHEQLRSLCLQAWEQIQAGQTNPLVQLLQHDPSIAAFVAPDKLLELMDITHYLGDAPARSLALAQQIEESIHPVKEPLK